MGVRSIIFRGIYSIGSKRGRYDRGDTFDFNQLQLLSGNGNGLFYEDIWEELYTEIIEAQQDKAGNAGQATLLGPDYFQNAAKDYCKTSAKDYDPAAFVTSVRIDLGDDYYNAISLIIDECAEELIEAWDRSTSNDGVGEKLFGGSNTVYGNFSNAMAIYSARAAGRYGAKWRSTAAANARSAAAARKFLAANPKGTSRTTRATPFAAKTYAQRNAASRATATKFLKANPKGTKRIF
jgi:hypothetical protein